MENSSFYYLGTGNEKTSHRLPLCQIKSVPSGRTMELFLLMACLSPRAGTPVLPCGIQGWGEHPLSRVKSLLCKLVGEGDSSLRSSGLFLLARNTCPRRRLGCEAWGSSILGLSCLEQSFFPASVGCVGGEDAWFFFVAPSWTRESFRDKGVTPLSVCPSWSENTHSILGNRDWNGRGGPPVFSAAQPQKTAFGRQKGGEGKRKECVVAQMPQALTVLTEIFLNEFFYVCCICLQDNFQTLNS